MSVRSITSEQQTAWLEMNQSVLIAHLERVRLFLESAIADTSVSGSLSRSDEDEAERQTAIADLCSIFDLSDFERDLLLLCAGVELDSRIAELCAQLNGDGSRPTISMKLACSVLPGAHWTAILPTSPLRRWPPCGTQSERNASDAG